MGAAASSTVQGQAFDVPPVQWPAVAERAMSVQGFVPDGWRLEHHVEGRLDDDARPDLLILLRMQDPANIVEHDGLGMSPFDTNPRMLVIALADPDGGYRRALVDRALIPRPESPVMDDVLQDDPAHAIRIADNRAFSVALHSWASAGSWFTSRRSFTFRWQDGCFRLIGLDTFELHRGSGATAEASINYLTGRAWTRTGSIEDDDGDRQPHRLAKRSMICLEDVGDGLSFQSGLTVED
ncbi:hypothetical protein E2F46_05220 [Luteimonas aestuarii]|uniref:Uncharacterized protein n=1 Tax=Luteimonas aestuarii TaxID=453837 RepID=A0A4R5TYM2_9GAMM|nr:hypothetical protein E2F46_05220 [Luteimonas aestuarii]